MIRPAAVLAALLLVVATLVALPSDAAPPLVTGRVPCASGGPPLLAGGGVFDEGMAPPAMGAWDPTVLLRLRTTLWAGGEADRAAGDPTTAAGVALERARIGLCGHGGVVAYRVVYEPWDATERARGDLPAWGRFTDLAAAWIPRSWAQISAGIGKVPLSRAREQPEGALALPSIAQGIASLAPDRRLGAYADADLGVMRIAAAATMANRRFEGAGMNGVLLAGRLVVEPIGPLGRRAWPESTPVSKSPAIAELAPWVDRPRLALGLSAAYRSGTPDRAWAVGADAALSMGRVYLGVDALVAAAAWPLERWTEADLPEHLRADLPAAMRPRGLRVAVAAEQVVRVWRRAVAVALREEYVDEGPGGRPRFLRFEVAATLNLGEALMAQIAWARTVPAVRGVDPGAGPDAVFIDLQLAR